MSKTIELPKPISFELLDFKQGQTKQIAPYQCKACEIVFTRLSGWVQHAKYHHFLNKCQDHAALKRYGLQEVQHTANGITYQAWEVRPDAQIDVVSEVLKELEQQADYKQRIAIDKSEASRNGRTYDQMAIDTANYQFTITKEEIQSKQRELTRLRLEYEKSRTDKPKKEKFIRSISKTLPVKKYTPQYSHPEEISPTKPFWMEQTENSFTEWDKAWAMFNPSKPNTRKERK
jgi:hypothetical protein